MLQAAGTAGNGGGGIEAAGLREPSNAFSPFFLFSRDTDHSCPHGVRRCNR